MRALAFVFLLGCGGEVFVLSEGDAAPHDAAANDVDAAAPHLDASLDAGVDAPAEASTCQRFPTVDFYCDAGSVAYTCDLHAIPCSPASGGVWCCK